MILDARLLLVTAFKLYLYSGCLTVLTPLSWFNHSELGIAICSEKDVIFFPPVR